MFWGTPRCARQLRGDPFEQAGIGQQPQPDRRPLGREQLRQLGRDPLAGQVADEVRVRFDAGQGGGLDREPERRREANRADHPERVLLEAFLRVADGAECPGGDVLPAAVRIDERRAAAPAGAPQATALTVKSRRARSTSTDVAELDAMWPPEVGVVVVGAERRHLVQLAAVADHHGPERVLVHGVREELEDLVGARIGGQVPVERRPAEQGIAQRAADDVRGMPGRPQEPHDLVDGTRDRCRERRLVGQLRPRNR